MDFTCMRYFLAAVQEQNISKAAEKLYVSRQALSKAIKRLEDQVGASLIIPVSKGIQLTADGETIYAAAQKILAIWDDVTARLPSVKSDTVTLRIGYGHNSYNVWPGNHMHRYMEQHPEIQLRLRSLPPDQLLEELRNENLDLAISNVNPKGDEFFCAPILSRPVYAMVHAQDALSGNEILTPQDLRDRNVYFIPYDQTGMKNFSALMELYGFSYTPMVSLDSTITTLCNELACHNGVFITSAIFWTTGQQQDFVLKPFDTGLPHAFYNMDINAITRRADAARQDLVQYLNYLKANVKPEFQKRK